VNNYEWINEEPEVLTVVVCIVLFFVDDIHPAGKPSEEDCSAMLDRAAETIPDSCKVYASIMAKLEKKAADPFAGMSAGSRKAVRNAQIQRRMSTRHGHGAHGKNTSWF